MKVSNLVLYLPTLFIGPKPTALRNNPIDDYKSFESDFNATLNADDKNNGL